ncbi:MAG TPA: hypothetical protein VFU94_02875 [Conexibacter sp.]|nr:hypothetical protein [Conexibacter sp.]
MTTAEAVPAGAAAVASESTAADLPPLLTDQWLELARAGGRMTLETLRAFAPALELAERAALAPYDALRHAVASAVLVNVDVDVNVASRTLPPG